VPSVDPIPGPTIGEPLPRATAAQVGPEKWRYWILAERGHGPEWAKVFHVDLKDAEKIWAAIANALPHAPIRTIVDHGKDGVVCGVDLELDIRARRATVSTAWHYEQSDAPPRLVTAYPRS
jgi:hypothetical protein